jgi:hypothetical protein
LLCGAWAGVAWWRYGRAEARDRWSDDALLDRFMPEYDVVERHSIRLAAPAALALAAAYDLDFERSPVLRAIFSTTLGAEPIGAAGSIAKNWEKGERP